MSIIMGILATTALAVGLFPQYIYRLIDQPLKILGIKEGIFTTPDIAVLSKISTAFLIFILLFLSIFALRKWLLRNKTVTSFKTWGCAYQAPSPRMQYTGSSYARIFLLLLKPIIGLKFYIKSRDSLFPSGWNLKTHFTDIFDAYIITPVSKSIRSSVKLFSWIQRGSTQQYILYGLLFLVIAILWILGTTR
jgi:hydrogenase-4 component B